ncbi:MAG: DUF6249 domain-containing protein [Methanococcaceae archaeon]
MNEGVVAVFVPIVMFLVIGLVLVTFFYLRSKEKQMLIEKGLTSDEIKSFYDKKSDPFIMLKLGVVALFFGLGLGIGMAMEDATGKEYWVPLFIFSSTGLGFIIANLVGNKMRKKESAV